MNLTLFLLIRTAREPAQAFRLHRRGNFAGNRTLRYVVGEDIIDAQVSYTFGQGSLDGLSLLLQAQNLTNSPYQTYATTRDRPLEYIEWGRTYLVGVSYKF